MGLRSLLVLLPLLFVCHAAAQGPGPEELVRKVTADLLEAVRSDKELLADRKRALALAEQKLLPHVDFRQAAQLAVGKLWWKASPAQQERIATEFRGMLIRIYSNAIDTYRGQTM
ncbi:MAG: ABC transporter substrate-binding protein, partial [Betaproteobacteria bacterium]|nr:ABC transporter substrate-binding protein [Betaproteobacteria bacterium]